MQQKLRPSTFLLAAAGILLGAAGNAPGGLSVQIADTGPLSTAASAAPAAPAPAPRAATKVISASVTSASASFEAAPVPNRNLDEPAQAQAAAGPELAPALLSEKALFTGNGFSGGSSQEQANNDRMQPAAGLSLSVPVK